MKLKVIIVFIVMFMIGLIYFIRPISNKVNQVVSEIYEPLRKVKEISKFFSDGSITTVFTSKASEIAGSNNLQFAKLKQLEVFEKNEIRRYFNFQVAEASVRVSIPVEYNYYIDLKAAWKFVYNLEKNTIHIYVPKISFNTPSVDVSGMEVEMKKSVFINEKKLKDKIFSRITKSLDEKANENINIIREVARRETESFVRNFLSHNFSNDFSDYEKIKSARMVVRFKDEYAEKITTDLK